MKANAGQTLTIRGSSKIELTDVLSARFGFAPVSPTATAVTVSQSQEEIANAKHPLIRHIKIPYRPVAQPENDVPNGWKVCSPQTAADFIAVGYYFARHLQVRLCRLV